MSPRIAIVIPTYNEKKAINKAITQIKKAVPHSWILVVDDNSPDGTAKCVVKRFGNDSSIRLLERKEKNGRGSAVIAGFQIALQDKTLQYFVEMDADLCHDPIFIPALVNTCKKADLAIASRYLPQSHVKGWSLKRRIMSRFMNLFAKTILHVPITDYTDGFRCYTRRVAQFLCKQKFQSKGFVMLSEIAYSSYKNGFQIREIPITMHVSNITKSNLTLKEIRESFSTILRLRFSRS